MRDEAEAAEAIGLWMDNRNVSPEIFRPRRLPPWTRRIRDPRPYRPPSAFAVIAAGSGWAGRSADRNRPMAIRPRPDIRVTRCKVAVI